jgi:SAM-dependent methyltransferase
VTTRYDEILDNLRRAYDAAADERDAMAKPPWKLGERDRFRAFVQSEGGTRLLEVGAGTGQDSGYFQEHGLDVVAVDLSPEMVARCRAKGLDAHVMDFLHLDFPPGSFDAVYAMNCLLHVPNADLPAVLAAIRDVLAPGGLFWFGQYAGRGGEGVAEQDSHDPPRFFAWRTAEQLRRYVRGLFDIVDYHPVPVEDGHQFHSLTLRRPV